MRVRRATVLALALAIGVLLWLRRAARRDARARLDPSAPPTWPPFEPAQPAEPISATEQTEPMSPTEQTRQTSPTWASPVERACPEGFPVKAKVASGVYHLPGMALYERTVPDRCYASPQDAEADGFRLSKR